MTTVRAGLAWMRARGFALLVSILALGATGGLLSTAAALEPGATEGAAEATLTEGAGGPAPDLIVIMVDDLGYIPDDRILERLPTIRETWLQNGLRLEGMHTETPLCCPARATFLTGDHTLGHEVITNDGDPMDPSTTIATALDDAGYHTMLMGKYLNDYEGTRTPPGWDRVMMRERNVGAVFSIDGELTRYRDMHLDDALREQAVAWVREAPHDEPLFALVSPRAPHRHPQDCERGDRACQYLPLVMEEDRGAAACADLEPSRPPNYQSDDNGRAVPWVMPDFPDGWPLGEICESMLVVDRMVAELIDAQAGRDRPAYLVFMSDNGMAWGQKGYPQKHAPPATRLPFYVAGPDVRMGRSEALVSNIDISPTLAALGGTRMDGPGESLLPLLGASDAAGRDEMLEVMPADPAGFYDGWAALRTPGWRFIRWDSGQRELYDLGLDPWELQNLVDEMPERAQELEERLGELLAASDA